MYLVADLQISVASLPARNVDVSKWARSLSSVSVTVLDSEGTGVNYTSTVVNGTPTFNGTIIRTPALKNLVSGKRYKILLHFEGDLFVVQDGVVNVCCIRVVR